MNLHTLHVEHIWLLAVYTVLTIANSRLHRGMRGLHSFSLYNSFALLGAIAVGLRGSLPDFVSVVLGDICVMAAYLLLFLSVSRTFGERRRETILAVLLFLSGVITMLQYGEFAPHTGRRLLAYSLILALQQAQIAIFLLDGRDIARRQVSWMLGAMLAALAVGNVVRIGVVLRQGAPDNYLHSGLALSAIVLANTCLQCGVVVAYIWMTTAMLRRDLEQQASTDPLTGLLNRRALELAAERELHAARSLSTPVSAVAIDLDDYKRINDQLGHAAGDAALLAVSRCLQDRLRARDRLARTGGDEFLVLLPGTCLHDAAGIAEGLRSCLASLDLQLADPSLRIVGSFGVAEANGSERWDDLLQRCDGALYEVKRQGGNQVLCRQVQAFLSSGELPARALGTV